MTTILPHMLHTQRLLVAFLCISLIACQQAVQTDTPLVPQAVQPIPQPYPQSDKAPIAPILGSYQASYYQESSSPINYPINQKTITLQLSAVSGDTIRVDVQATANGKYSPGQNLTYPKAVVVSKLFTDGSVTYYVYLNQPTTQDCGSFNVLYIYTNHSMDYSFVAPGNQPCIGARVRLTQQQ